MHIHRWSVFIHGVSLSTERIGQWSVSTNAAFDLGPHVRRQAEFSSPFQTPVFTQEEYPAKTYSDTRRS
jgi:hypothetical protein